MIAVTCAIMKWALKPTIEMSVMHTAHNVHIALNVHTAHNNILLKKENRSLTITFKFEFLSLLYCYQYIIPTCMSITFVLVAPKQFIRPSLLETNQVAEC